jgi:hypothetical protein
VDERAINQSSIEENQMPISRPQAREICTKPEMELVEASFAPAINALTPARLRSKITRARKLQDKYQEMARSQHRTVKDKNPTARLRNNNVRTERKARLFEETRIRFEKRLARLEGTETPQEEQTESM